MSLIGYNENIVNLQVNIFSSIFYNQVLFCLKDVNFSNQNHDVKFWKINFWFGIHSNSDVTNFAGPSIYFRYNCVTLSIGDQKRQ